MTTSITVRDVPDETRNELASRAARSGRSLQEYLRLQLVEFASRPEIAATLETVRERKRRTGSRLPSESILAARDSDRR
jgi:plasmid stability protein